MKSFYPGNIGINMAELGKPLKINLNCHKNIYMVGRKNRLGSMNHTFLALHKHMSTHVIHPCQKYLSHWRQYASNLEGLNLIKIK